MRLAFLTLIMFATSGMCTAVDDTPLPKGPPLTFTLLTDCHGIPELAVATYLDNTVVRITLRHMHGLRDVDALIKFGNSAKDHLQFDELCGGGTDT